MEVAAQKNKKILSEIAKKAQKQIFWLAMIKLLYIYIIFAIDSPDFSLTSLQKIVICKNNSMRTSLNSSFNVSILSAKS